MNIALRLRFGQYSDNTMAGTPEMGFSECTEGNGIRAFGVTNKCINQLTSLYNEPIPATMRLGPWTNIRLRLWSSSQAGKAALSLPTHSLTLKQDFDIGTFTIRLN